MFSSNTNDLQQNLAPTCTIFITQAGFYFNSYIYNPISSDMESVALFSNKLHSESIQCIFISNWICRALIRVSLNLPAKKMMDLV